MRTYASSIAVLLLASVAFAQSSTESATTESAPAPTRVSGAHLQTLLARSGFSPGLIDGKPGRKAKIALEAFQAANSLSVTGTATVETLTALGATDTWKRTYRISAADAALVTGPIPDDWNDRAKLTVSGYADMEELLAERGWCSIDLVRTLNPGIDLKNARAGDEVQLPDISPKPLPRIGKLEIDLEEKLVKGFDDSGRHVLLLHCSIARNMEKRPVGLLRVEVVATDPNYTFNPKDWPEVNNVTRKLTIAPGPRNPVGSAWVGLDKPGYGIHGTVRPQDIGKTGSHGCFRLANWDAVRLAKAIRIGTTVDVRE